MKDFVYKISPQELKAYYDKLTTTPEGKVLIETKGQEIFSYITQYIEDMHQYAFFQARDIAFKNPTISVEELKAALIEEEKFYTELHPTERIMGIENDWRMNSFAKNVYEYFKSREWVFPATPNQTTTTPTTTPTGPVFQSLETPVVKPTGPIVRDNEKGPEYFESSDFSELDETNKDKEFEEKVTKIFYKCLQNLIEKRAI